MSSINDRVWRAIKPDAQAFVPCQRRRLAALRFEAALRDVFLATVLRLRAAGLAPVRFASMRAR